MCKDTEPTFTLNSKFLSLKSEQKDLGIIMAPKLSWKLNADKRCKKAWKAFNFLERSISPLASKDTKLGEQEQRLKNNI